jgi:hypothetical protein
LLDGALLLLAGYIFTLQQSIKIKPILLLAFQESAGGKHPLALPCRSRIFSRLDIQS